MLFDNHLTTCEFSAIDSGRLLYQIKIPQSTPKLITNFLNLNMPEGDNEAAGLFKKFIAQIIDESCIKLTFSQEAGFRDDKLIRINAYHPFIVAAQLHFSKTERPHENTFKFGLRKEDTPTEFQHINTLILAQYRSTIIKNLLGREQRMELITPILYDFDKQEVISDLEFRNRIFADVQTKASATSTVYQLSPDDIQELSYVLTEEISIIESNLLEDHKMRLDTSKKLQVQRISEYFDNRIQNQESILNNSLQKLEILLEGNERNNIQRILPVQKKQLQNLMDEKIEAIRKINEGVITSKSPELMTLSLISLS